MRAPRALTPRLCRALAALRVLHPAARDGHLPAQIADVTRHQDRRTLDGYIQAGKGAQHLARVL
ncbi:hypothetical protein [Gaiella sp.]|uniref:hypothetical protein n=1 Tax=Gaiella sp. TaxID=2663207 RepID=UPI00398346E2